MEQLSALDRQPSDPYEALTQWMQMYGNDIWMFVYSSVRHRDIADDLTQETFVRAFTHAGQFQGRSSVKTWLFTIARNVVKDHRRSAYVRRVQVTEDIERHVDEQPVEHADTETVMLWDIVMLLKPSYREVVILRLREELPFMEISRITGVSEALLRVRYQRALKAVRKLLEAKGGNPND